MNDTVGDKLTRDQRRVLGVAIAMAHADGVIEDRELALIDTLERELELSDSARAEVEQMIKHAPTAEDIARWCVTDRDRLDIYAVALQMAEADKRVVEQEEALLDQLATLLGLSDSDLERAAALAHGGAA